MERLNQCGGDHGSSLPSAFGPAIVIGARWTAGPAGQGFVALKMPIKEHQTFPGDTALRTFLIFCLWGYNEVHSLDAHEWHDEAESFLIMGKVIHEGFVGNQLSGHHDVDFNRFAGS